MKKLKQKLLLFALLGASMGGLVLSVITPALADSFGAQTLRVLGFLPKLLFDIVMNILNFIFGIIAAVITFFGQITLNIALNSDPNFVINSAVTGKVWEKMLTLTNGIYLLILIAASIAIILRVNVGVYNVKKILGSLVTAIALSNLSLLIVRVLVEFSTAITTGLTALFGFNQSYKSFLLALLWETQPITYVADGAPSGMELIIAWIIFFLVATLVTKLAIILLERMIWIFALAIVAPLAFAVGVLPNMQSYSKQWWENLIKWVMVLPATIGITCLAIYVMTNGNSNSATTISQQVLALSGLFRVNDANLITIDPPLIMMLAGLAILWFAGEVGKKMKLGTATGTVFKGVSDTLTGKNAVGKFAKEKYYEEAYPRLMKNEKFAKWEGERQATTKGLRGYLFNRKGVLSKRKSDTEQTAKETVATAQAQKVGNLGEKLAKEKSDLAKYNQYLNPNGTLKENAPIEAKNAYKKYAKNEEEFKSERGALRKFHIKNLNKDYTPETIPTYEELEDKFKNAMSTTDVNGKAKDINYGEANGALDLMLRLSRAGNIRKEDAEKASGFLDKSSTKDVIENKLHLNPKEFRSRLKIQDKLKAMKVADPDTDELLIRTGVELNKKQALIKTLKSNYKIGTVINDPEKLDKVKNIDNQINVLGQRLTPGYRMVALQRIIAARNAVQPEDVNDPDKITKQLLKDPSFSLDELEVPQAADYYTNVTDLLTTTDKDVVDTYINVKNASPQGKTITDVIAEVELANKEEADLIKKQSILDATVKMDNTTSKPNYEILIRNNIKKRMSTPGVSSYDAKTQANDTLTEIKDITTNLLKTNSHSQSLNQVSPTDFANIRDKYKAMGFLDVSDKELQDKTIGEFHADVRRAQNALSKMDQPGGGGKSGAGKSTK